MVSALSYILSYYKNEPKEKKIIIICDSREKKPLIFNSPEITEIRTETLLVGDYQVVLDDGYKVPVIFERKGSLSDLWKTLTIEYPRFKKEIDRAKANNITLILIIEGSLSKVLKGFSRSKVEGISIIKTIFSLWIRYGVITIFTRDRREMENYIVHYFWAEQRKRNEKKELTKKEN